MVLNFDSLSRYEIPKMTLCYANSRYLDLEDDVWDFGVEQSGTTTTWARNKTYSKGQKVIYNDRICQSLIPSNIYEPNTTGTVLTRVIGEIVDKDNEELVINFNQTSTLSFRAYKVDSHNDDLQNKIAKRVYDNLKNRKSIFVEGIGFFIITEVKSEYKDGQYYKDVEATSAEIEIENKMIPYIGEGRDETGAIQAMSGTFAFRDLLTQLMTATPKWTIGYIDNKVSALYRTFDDVSTDTNILSFMLEDMQEAYECVFVFDIINRVVNVYAQSNYINNTNIHLTTDDLINTLTVEEKSDDIYTVLEVDCDDELIAFNAINPTYDSRLYDFTYYLDEMSPSLRTKVINYQNYIKNQMKPGQTNNFYYYATQKWMAFNNQMMAQCEKDKADIEYNMYMEVYANLGATNSTSKLERNNDDLEEQLRAVDASYAVANNDSYYNNKRMMTVGDIASTRSAINDMAAQAMADGVSASSSVNSYKNQVATWTSCMENVSAPFKAGDGTTYKGGYFTEAEFEELSDYISEGKYSDSYVIYTDGMNWIDKCNQLIEVYNRAREQMDRVSMPVFELNIDAEDFVFEEKFEEFTSQLGVGKFVHIEIENNVNAFPSWTFGTEYSVGDRVRYNEVAYRCIQAHTSSSGQNPASQRTLWEVDDVDIADMFLNQITVNYYDNSLKMRFGSRYSKMDNKSLFDETLGKINKAANSVSYMTGAYDLIAGNYNDMAEKLQNSRNLSMKDALNSKGQEIVINEYGFTGRKLYDKNADVVNYNTGRKYGSRDGVYDNRQVKLVNNLLAFTSDGWENCDVAIGELKVQQLKKAVDSNGDTDTEERNVYGINAKYIVGDMIIGNGLRIYDNKGRLMFGVNEATGTNGGNIDLMVHGADDDGNPITYGLSQTLAGTVFYDSAGKTSVINGDKITTGHIKVIGGSSDYNNWSTNAQYTIGDMINYGGTVYECIKAHRSSGTNSPVSNTASTYWKVAEGAGLDIGNGEGIEGELSGDNIASGAISDRHITEINGGKITAHSLDVNEVSTGTIDADTINVQNISADNIVTGVLKCETYSGPKNSEYHYSSNGVSGVTLGGNIDCNDGLTIRGLNAEWITVGKLKANQIDADQITADHIRAGEVTSDKLTLYGAMDVYAEKGGNIGGSFGYYGGNTGTASTDGMSMSARGGNHVTVTNGGAVLDGGSYAQIAGTRIVFNGTVNSFALDGTISGGTASFNTYENLPSTNLSGYATRTWVSSNFAEIDSDGAVDKSNALYYAYSSGRYLYGDGETIYSYFANQSDRRVKCDINYENIPDIIDQIRPVTFVFSERDDNKTHIGLIAQDVEQVLKDNAMDDYGIVYKFKDEFDEAGIWYKRDSYAIRYNEFVPLLIDKCQKQQKQIDEQQNKINDLEERLARLEALIN